MSDDEIGSDDDAPPEQKRTKLSYKNFQPINPASRIKPQMTTFLTAKFGELYPYLNNTASGSIDIKAHEKRAATNLDTTKEKLDRCYDNLLVENDNGILVIQRPPFDDVRHVQMISNPTCVAMVFGADQVDAYVKSGKWQLLTNVVVHTKDSVITSADIDGTAMPTSGAVARRGLPMQFEKSEMEKIKTVSELVCLVEIGTEEQLPAIQWTKQDRSNAGWGDKAADNFLNAMKLYIYVQHNHATLSAQSIISKTSWRNEATVVWREGGVGSRGDWWYRRARRRNY